MKRSDVVAEIWFWHGRTPHHFDPPIEYTIGPKYMATDQMNWIHTSVLNLGDNRPYFCRSVMNHIFQDGECVFCQYKEEK